MHKLIPLVVMLIAATTATAGHAAPKPKKISYREASAFEAALLARNPPMPMPPRSLQVQPINKAEPCRLPTTQDQLDRPNFRAFWDGECRNGFAFGLGRDIAISDTHHLEEITVHDGTGDSWSRPRVAYDFVNNVVAHVVGGPQFPVQVALVEKMETTLGGFDILRTLSLTDGFGGVATVQSAAFQPQRHYVLVEKYGAIAFRFVDASAAPATDPNAVAFSAEILDPQGGGMPGNIPGGVAALRFANGSIGQFAVVDGRSQPVSLPPAYTDHLMAKYQAIQSAAAQADIGLQQAQRIEREYLFKACNGRSGLKGLDDAEYTRICHWRDQFSQAYQTASANYQRQLAELNQQAAAARQQRQMEEQFAVQQLMMQRQQDQQGWALLNQGAQMLQQQTQQTLQGIQNWQPPQLQPITPPGGYKVICNHIGNMTTCR